MGDPFLSEKVSHFSYRRTAATWASLNRTKRSAVCGDAFDVKAIFGHYFGKKHMSEAAGTAFDLWNTSTPVK